MNMRMLLAALAISVPHTACDRSSRANAAEDPQRYVGGAFYLSAGEHPQSKTVPLGTGPFFLTDLMIEDGMGEIVTSTDPECKNKEAEDHGKLFTWLFPYGERTDVESHHGMRLLIAEGKTLCFKVMSQQTHLVWAGFRPYAASQ